MGNGISLCKTEDLFSDFDLATANDSNSSSSSVLSSSSSVNGGEKSSLDKILPTVAQFQIQQNPNQPPEPSDGPKAKKLKIDDASVTSLSSSSSSSSGSSTTSCFLQFMEALLVDLFSHKWETRHGAAIGLRAIMKHTVCSEWF